MSTINRQFRIAARPVGMVKESDFEYAEGNVPDIAIEDSGPGVWPKLEKPKQEKLVHNVCTAHGMYKQYYGTTWRCKR